MDSVLLIVGAIALIVLILLPFVPWRRGPRCPERGSRQVGRQRKASGMRTSDCGGGGYGGGHSSVQMQYEVRYRCNDCQATWTRTETETR